jgi:hypothetical protein
MGVDMSGHARKAQDIPTFSQRLLISISNKEWDTQLDVYVEIDSWSNA